MDNITIFVNIIETILLNSYNYVMSTVKIKDGFKNEKIIICPESITKQFDNIPTIYNLLITDIGLFPNAKFHYRERSKGVNEHILIFCTGGEGFVEFNGVKYSLSKSDIIIIPPNTPHLYFTNNDNPWDILWVHFKGDYTKYFFKDYEFNNLIHCSIDIVTKLNFIFNDILNILEKGLTENNLVYASQSLCHMISLILINNVDSNYYINNSSRYIDKAISYMNDNLNKHLSLDEIANIIGLSRSHTSLIFKQHTNYSPLEFFTHIKIQTACSLLKYGTTSIKEISYTLGYEDQYYFSRVFKKVMGVSPLGYRNIYYTYYPIFIIVYLI